MNFWDTYNGKKVLITGDTGFKGSWLAIWLKQLGAEVYGYALPAATTEDNFVSCNLEKEINHKDGDVRNLNDLKEYFNQVQPDIAFHLAAQPLVLLSYKNPKETFETNLMGAVNFFEAVRLSPSVKAAVNVTSDKCYDNKEWVWGYRENDAMGGKDPYSASKGCAELITSSYLYSYFNQIGSCAIASARAGNVIGGGDWAADRIVPDFFRAVKANEKLYVRNPLATRPWQHVLEPLSGYLSLASKLFTEGKKYSGGWNFGPEDSANYSVEDLIQSILKIHSSEAYSISENFTKQHEANFLKLDISKAVNKLNWRPTLMFEETVRFTVEGYVTEMSGGNIFNARLDQIKEYSLLAKKRKIDWANENQ